MSAFLLGIGFRADMGTCARKLVLLKLIDACEEDGTRIFPAIATIARAAQCSTRQVQRELQAFREAGLIRIVREGGKGPRSTNEYALDLDVLGRLGKEGWEAVANGKGDTVSPLDDADKGDAGDAERVTRETAKGDKLSHPTPPDPSLDPSIERDARGRETVEPRIAEAEDPKKVEADGWALLKNWPGFDGMPKKPALAVWMGMSAADRADARRRFLPWLELIRRQKKSHIPAPSTYLTERLWEAAQDPADAPPPPQVAAPFGKAWGAIRLAALVAGPGPLPAPSSFIASLIAAGGPAGERERLRHQATHGWPKIKRMDEVAASRRGWTVSQDDDAAVRAAEAFAPVRVGGEAWAAWAAHFERLGWPWLPDPGRQEWVYFPAGGPDGLSDFDAAVRGDGHDGDRCEAAE